MNPSLKMVQLCLVMLHFWNDVVLSTSGKSSKSSLRMHGGRRPVMIAACGWLKCVCDGCWSGHQTTQKELAVVVVAGLAKWGRPGEGFRASWGLSPTPRPRPAPPTASPGGGAGYANLELELTKKFYYSVKEKKVIVTAAVKINPTSFSVSLVSIHLLVPSDAHRSSISESQIALFPS